MLLAVYLKFKKSAVNIGFPIFTTLYFMPSEGTTHRYVSMVQILFVKNNVKNHIVKIYYCNMKPIVQ